MATDSNPHEQWARVAADLRAYRDAQLQVWGDIDNVTIGRYLVGEATVEERRRIETALEQHPELGKLVELVGNVLSEVGSPEESSAVAPAPSASASVTNSAVIFEPIHPKTIPLPAR